MPTQKYDPGDGLPPYRCGVGIIVFNQHGQVLGCVRAANKSADRFENPLQFPQGGIDIGEDEEATAYRELYEEVGLTRDQVKLLARAPEYTFYEFPDIMVQNWSAEGSPHGHKYRGQRHVWFAFLLTDDEHAFSFDHHHEVEFESAGWVDIDAVINSVVEFKRAAYAKAADMFRPLIADLKRKA